MIQLLAEQDRYIEIGILMMTEDENNNEPIGSSLKEATNFLPGDIIASRFEVIRPLRDGCQGAIYLVRHIDFPERKIAMKVLLLDQKEGFEITAARFRNEVKAAYSVTHPNVVRVYDYVREGRTIAFSMEYVVGGDLADLLAYEEPLKINQVVNILEQICHGVQAIHEAGIIHRDLKPENILINKQGEVKISDFGTARMGTTLGRKGGITGTVAYLSPEYLKDGQLDARSDLYSLGIVAFEMITGQTPFKGDSLIETLTMRLHEMAPSIKEFNKDCPTSLCNIVDKLLSLNPDDRFDSAESLLKELKKVRIRKSSFQNIASTKILEGEGLDFALPKKEKEHLSFKPADPLNGGDARVTPRRTRAATITENINEHVNMPYSVWQWLILAVLIIVGFAAGQLLPLIASSYFSDSTSSSKILNMQSEIEIASLK